MREPEPQSREIVRQEQISLYDRSKRLKPAVLKELTPRMRLMAEYMVVGCHLSHAEGKTGKPRGTPLSLEEAADLVGIRRRNARDLVKQAVFVRHLSSELEALKTGHKAEAVRTMVQVMRDPGQGKAADRKVRLEAASMITGEQLAGKAAPQANINVQVNNHISPGYVIRAPQVLRDPPVIDAVALPADDQA